MYYDYFTYFHNHIHTNKYGKKTFVAWAEQDYIFRVRLINVP